MTVAIACGLFVACAKPSGGRVYLVGESRVVSGIVGAQKGVDLKGLKISLIDGQGLRSTPYELKYNSDQGQFSFQLRDSDLYDIKKATALDRILSMGNALPAVSLGDSEIVGKVNKYARIELMQSALNPVDYQVIPYFQAQLPLSRRNLMAGKDVIGVDGQITFSKAGFVRVKVTDESGKALSGVKVAGVADGKIGTGAPLWHDALLRPIFETTGADGTAFIGPIDASVELTRYHILAVAEGYCTYLSAPTNNFSLVEKAGPVVKLRSCEKSANAVNDLLPSFPDGMKYIEVEGRKVAHTKEDSILLRLDARGEKLRGVKVTLYETNDKYEPQLEPTGEPREVSTFQAEFSVTLPKIFKVSGATDGKFLIKVTRILGTLDGPEATPELYPELIVYGHKKVGAPSREELMKVKISQPDITDASPPTDVDEWTKLKIASVTGTTNIVPGLAGGTFTMTSSFCGDGDALGFSIPAYSMLEPVFKDCVKNVATFTAEEAGFITRANKITQLGGRQKWRVFIKDKFGNVSETLEDPNAPSPKRLNVVTVIIDTARPFLTGDLPENGFELNKFLFKKSGTSLSSDANPLNPSDVANGLVTLNLKKIGTGEGTCEQDPATGTDDEKKKNGSLGGNANYLNGVSGHIFRDDLNRLIAKTVEDPNTKFENLGLTIFDWVIGASSSAVSSAAQSTYTRCRELDGLNPSPLTRELKEGDIVFPETASAEAEFYMRFRDVSGLLSNPIKYTIPACITGFTSLCWKN